MKKLFCILALAGLGCNFVTKIFATREPVDQQASVTPTPLVVPTVVPVTLQPTPTPIIITPTPVSTYVVQKGDTLSGIAQKFGLTVGSLAAANNITDPNLIYPGQVLIIRGLPIGLGDAEEGPPIPDIKEGKEIVVVIHTQRVYAFEDGSLLKNFLVSTGTADHPTVLGKFHVMAKLKDTRMTDWVTYDHLHVLWTMYFGNDQVSWHDGYSLHGTNWHHNFGHPMSHGCINLTVDDAEWLFNWADPPTEGLETYSEDTTPGTTVWIIP